jgi:lysophospholipase L1-like esterase
LRAPRLPWRECLLALAAILLGAGVFELGGQIYASRHPAFEVLHLEPDRVLGWKEVPGLTWQWAGRFWYGDEFSVTIHTNSQGFRDAEREPTKPPRVVRVAVLGDSYVEALQVPLEKRSTELLEERLNRAAGAEGRGGRRVEVLNFGISGYGLGQELLAWQEHASHYDPDYALVFCAGYSMWRTTDKKARGGFPATKDTDLWIRPSFRLEAGRLVLEPARDYDAFVENQRFVMRTVFGGGRSARRPRKSFLETTLARSWKMGGDWLGSLLHGRHPTRPMLMIFRDPTAPVLALNLAILEELGREAEVRQCRVVLVDLSSYFNGASALPVTLARFCQEHRMGYARPSDDLLGAEQKGQSVQLPQDTHFTELGNRIMADALATWLSSHPKEAP